MSSTDERDAMEGGGSGFQCPEDFECVAKSHKSATSDEDVELWLIKAPADFNPESLNSRRFPLSGYKMQKIKDGGVKKYYHMVASPGTDLSVQPLLQTEDKLVPAAPFQGVITMAEAHGDHTGVHSIPDRPPLSLPQGLKQRYRPFGALVPKKRKTARKSEISESAKKKKTK
ncbi:hypothetical protein GDO81_022413 [Engystomops pustulosus]|uniref:Uncharacterized protein n=1 Tax=Engystomops pustulosus TaxID=76066 RepID=A0AAV6ZF33_ENGPU|nr:hypothetical protein GDO81_022413 [Engystomops pustulosus]